MRADVNGVEAGGDVAVVRSSSIFLSESERMWAPSTTSTSEVCASMFSLAPAAVSRGAVACAYVVRPGAVTTSVAVSSEIAVRDNGNKRDAGRFIR